MCLRSVTLHVLLVITRLPGTAFSIRSNPLRQEMSVEKCPSNDVRRERGSFGSGGRHNRSYRREKLSALQLYMDMVGRRFGSNTLAFSLQHKYYIVAPTGFVSGTGTQ
jgi:hypothetical protein